MTEFICLHLTPLGNLLNLKWGSHLHERFSHIFTTRGTRRNCNKKRLIVSNLKKQWKNYRWSTLRLEYTLLLQKQFCLWRENKQTFRKGWIGNLKQNNPLSKYSFNCLNDTTERNKKRCVYPFYLWRFKLKTRENFSWNLICFKVKLL